MAEINGVNNPWAGPVWVWLNRAILPGIVLVWNGRSFSCLLWVCNYCDSFRSWWVGFFGFTRRYASFPLPLLTRGTHQRLFGINIDSCVVLLVSEGIFGG